MLNVGIPILTLLTMMTTTTVFVGAQFFHPILPDQTYLKMIEVSINEEVKTAENDMMKEVNVLRNLTDILVTMGQLKKKVDKELESLSQGSAGQRGVLTQTSLKVKGTKQSLAGIVDSVDEAVDDQLGPALGGFVTNNVDTLSEISRIFAESVRIAFPELLGTTTTTTTNSPPKLLIKGKEKPRISS